MSGSTLLLDFGANRKSVRNKRVFSNSLEDQFTNLPLGDDYEDFVRDNFIRDDCKVFISWPNFKREPSESKYGQYYNNIALRFPNMESEGRDVVLMCDIFEKKQDQSHPERPVDRKFQVKSILLMDPNITHYGEIERICSIIVNLGEKESVMWEAEGWNNKWPTDDHLRSNVLSNDFLVEISKKYVVQSASKVKTELRNWRKYIESREYIIDVDSKNGYCLDSCQPEFMKAFSTIGDFEASDYGAIEHLDPKVKEWTLDRVNAESREALLMHIYVDVLEKDYLSSKGTRDNLKSKLDRFTRAPLFLEDEESEKNRGKPGQNRLRIADRRLHASEFETVEPMAAIESIKAECQRRIESAKKKNKAYMESEVDRSLQEFEHGSLPEILRQYSSEQRVPITNRISAEYSSKKEKARVRLSEQLDANRKKASEIRAKIDALKAGHSDNGESKGKAKKKTASDPLKELESSLSKVEGIVQELTVRIDGLDDEYDPMEAIEVALKRDCDAFREEKLSEKRDSIESGLKPEFQERLDRDIAVYKSNAEDSIEEAKKEGNIARFHLFFEVEIADTESIDVKMKSLSPFMRSGLKLNRDFTGEETVLRRQKEALGNLEEGYVLNPFLATFLFSPRSEGRSTFVQMSDDDFINKSLNDSQKEAVQMALSSNGLFLIQGPPGTGKTQVIAEISVQLARSNRKVLIASQNNKAVDNAFDRMPKIPSVRLLRVLSEKATKQGNDYSVDELVGNFYKNLSESMDNERMNLENRTIHMKDLESSIEDLSVMLQAIEACQEYAKAADKEVAEAEDDLRIAYNRKDDVENSNIATGEKIEQNEGAIRSLDDLSDEKMFKMVAGLVEESGLALAELSADPREVLKSLHSVSRDSIIAEYASVQEHDEYFEYLREKAAATDLNEKARLNQRINLYKETYDFDPQSSIPFLTTLDKIPEMNAVLKAKEEMDKHIDKKRANLKRSGDSLRSGLASTDEIDSEIHQLKKRIEALKKDPSYAKLKEAEASFDAKANEIYTDLRIPMSGGNRSQVLSRLKDERSRFELSESEKDEAEERIRTYNDISRYISDESIIEHDRESYRNQLLDTVNVFGMTCSAKASFRGEGLGNVSLNERNIDVVIVDEVSKVPFVEILQPILFGKTVILVGDHRQLPPMFDRRIEKGEDNSYDPKFINESDEEMYKRMYEESFFAKLFNDAPSSMKVQLSTQYRMHPDIMDVDNMFYRIGPERGLTFGGNEVQKKHYLEVTGASGRKVIGDGNHVIFVDVRGREKKESGSTSYTNPEEAAVVQELLRLIDKNIRYDGDGKRLESSYKGRSDPRLSVGVICAYADQAKEIRKHKGVYRNFSRSPDSPFMVKTVDDFQGDERDIIILSLVRSRESQFLTDYRRINVAISRARRLLIIVGNKANLEKMPVDLDGKSLPVYRDILKSIERKDGMRTEADIVGGE